MNIDYTFVGKHYAARDHAKMQEVLMDPNGVGPAVHYYMIRGGKDQRNITVWEPGTVSGEYIKTYGHYHIGNLDETYWVLFGTGIVLKQKMAVDENGVSIPDVIETFEALEVTTGDSVYMPPGHGHLLVNTGATYFVTADNSPVNFDEANPVSMPGHADYQVVKQMRGFAYYVIEKNGAPALVKNPLYKEVRHAEFNGIMVVE